MIAEYCCDDVLVVEPADDIVAESYDSLRLDEGCSNLAEAVADDKTLEALNF